MKKKSGTSSHSSWEADSLKVVYLWGKEKIILNMKHILLNLILICLFFQVNLPDQPTITSVDSSITVSFTSYDNLGSMMNMDSDFSSSVLSVNVIGVEKVNM